MSHHRQIRQNSQSSNILSLACNFIFISLQRAYATQQDNEHIKCTQAHIFIIKLNHVVLIINF